jgi:hypothetical protein
MVVPDTTHTPGSLAGSTENTTGLPERPPVADRCAEPPAVPAAGAVKEIDWVSFGSVV